MKKSESKEEIELVPGSLAINETEEKSFLRLGIIPIYRY